MAEGMRRVDGIVEYKAVGGLGRERRRRAVFLGAMAEMRLAGLALQEAKHGALLAELGLLGGGRAEGGGVAGLVGRPQPGLGAGQVRGRVGGAERPAGRAVLAEGQEGGERRLGEALGGRVGLRRRALVRRLRQKRRRRRGLHAGTVSHRKQQQNVDTRARPPGKGLWCGRWGLSASAGGRRGRPGAPGPARRRDRRA